MTQRLSGRATLPGFEGNKKGDLLYRAYYRNRGAEIHGMPPTPANIAAGEVENDDDTYFDGQLVTVLRKASDEEAGAFAGEGCSVAIFPDGIARLVWPDELESGHPGGGSVTEQPNTGSGVKDLLAELLVSRDHAIKELAAELRRQSTEICEKGQKLAEMERDREAVRKSMRAFEQHFRMTHTFDGKTVADRDAQLLDALADSPDWREAVSALARGDKAITEAKLLLEHRERLFKIALSQLRTYGGER